MVKTGMRLIDEALFFGRSFPDLNLPEIIEGLRQMGKVYRGDLFKEVVLLAGFNENRQEISGLKKALEDIGPDRIQLNTVVRLPSDGTAVAPGMKPVSRKEQSLNI